MGGHAVPVPGATTLLRENPYEFLSPDVPRRRRLRKVRRGKPKPA